MSDHDSCKGCGQLDCTCPRTIAASEEPVTVKRWRINYQNLEVKEGTFLNTPGSDKYYVANTQLLYLYYPVNKGELFKSEREALDMLCEHCYDKLRNIHRRINEINRQLSSLPT